MIEVRQLRYFLVVAEELHFGRAAERLHMAQSPLSQQILHLEREIGVQLLERGHHVVGLTDAGRTMVGATREILESLERAVSRTRRASRGEVGNLCVGYVSEVTGEVLPVGLHAYKARYPDVAIDLRQGITGVLLEALRRREIDVAFVRTPGRLDGVEYETLVEEPLLLALPDGHALVSEHSALSQLVDEPFVLPSYEAAQGLRRDIDRACAREGFVPDVVRETSPLTAVLLLVAAGTGVALIPASASRSYPMPGVRYMRLSDRPQTAAGIAWRRDDSSAVVQTFVEAIRAVVASKVDFGDVRLEPRVAPSGHSE